MDIPRYHTCASLPTCRIYVHPFRNSFGLIELCRLSQDTRLTSDSCSSGWSFVIGSFIKVVASLDLHDSLVLPRFGRTADFHRIDTRALLGAQSKPPERFYTSGRSLRSTVRDGLPSHSTVVIRFRLRLERMPHTNSGTPVFIQVAAARAFDVGPEVRGVGQVEVGTKTVFNPSVLAVDFNNAGAAGSRTRDLAVAKEFVNDRCAEIDMPPCCSGT